MEVGLLSNIDNLAFIFFNYSDDKNLLSKILLLVNFNFLVKHISVLLHFL